MADNTENHPLVDLMLERMKSHPEEFEDQCTRWDEALSAIQTFAPESQKELIRQAQSNILLDVAYREAMDELLNGEQRRAEAKAEEAEKARQLAALTHQMSIGRQRMGQQMQQDYDNAMLAGLGQYAQEGSAQGVSTLGSLQGLSVYKGSSTTWSDPDDLLTTTASGSSTSWTSSIKKALGL